MSKNVPIPIVIAAYRRSHSLQRLLTSISNSHFDGDEVKIIVSLDGGCSVDVKRVATAFQDDHSDYNVEIIQRQKNLGLREHLLWCGSQSELYGSVIVLEEDLFVDPWFYVYAKRCLAFYKNDTNIAGISLYSPRYCESARLPFEPLKDNTDTYFLQHPCSWGQAWTADQWARFRRWYQGADVTLVNSCLRLSSFVKEWGETSWKKYFAAYMTINDLFFVYPYRSFATNFSDAGGAHVREGTWRLQVPLAVPSAVSGDYTFAKFSTESVVYDAFWEFRYGLPFIDFGIPIDDCEIDLYGSKPLSLLLTKRYSVTIKDVSQAIRRFPLSRKPLPLVILDEGSQDCLPIKLAKSCHVKDSIAPDALFNLINYLSYTPLLYKKNATAVLFGILREKVISRSKSFRDVSMILKKILNLWM